MLFLLFRYHIHLANRNLQEYTFPAVYIPVREIWSLWNPWSCFYTFRALTEWLKLLLCLRKHWLELILGGSLRKVLGGCGVGVTTPYQALPGVHTLQHLLTGELALLSPTDALNTARLHLGSV